MKLASCLPVSTEGSDLWIVVEEGGRRWRGCPEEDGHAWSLWDEM